MLKFNSKFINLTVKFTNSTRNKIKILGLFGQITFKNFSLLHIITRNYAQSHEKKIKNIRYALLRLITANYTQSKFEKK
jgi:hypothetical protein